MLETFDATVTNENIRLVIQFIKENGGFESRHSSDTAEEKAAFDCTSLVDIFIHIS
jgi:hypothetical protein